MTKPQARRIGCGHLWGPLLCPPWGTSRGGRGLNLTFTTLLNAGSGRGLGPGSTNQGSARANGSRTSVRQTSGHTDVGDRHPGTLMTEAGKNHTAQGHLEAHTAKNYPVSHHARADQRPKCQRKAMKLLRDTLSLYLHDLGSGWDSLTLRPKAQANKQTNKQKEVNWISLRSKASVLPRTGKDKTQNESIYLQIIHLIRDKDGLQHNTKVSELI